MALSVATAQWHITKFSDVLQSTYAKKKIYILLCSYFKVLSKAVFRTASFRLNTQNPCRSDNIMTSDDAMNYHARGTLAHLWQQCAFCF